MYRNEISRLFKRLNQSPGIPVPSPSTSYWLIPPSPISNHGSDGSTPLPDYADVVVIGSGITGTSFVRALMKNSAKGDDERRPLTVVMLEARDVCSGATGRNGGHITPILYAHYQWLKDEFGADVAKDIIRFRLKHLPELVTVAAEENLLEDSQCREVESFDVFHDKGLYSQVKEMLSVYQKELPLEGSSYRTHEGDETFKNLQLSSKTVGCLSTRGRAIHPYRLVTGILERLLKSYSKNFYLFMHTPCTAIKTCPQGLYELSTPKGAIKTSHVVHATNAWASHLLPGMRRRIVPVRAVMTAQVPMRGLGSSPGDKKPWTSTRSFTFYPGESLFAFDYLTQQTVKLGETDEESVWPAPRGELMFGGGFASNRKSTEDLFAGGLYPPQFDLANADDSAWNEQTASYLGKVLSEYFEAKDGEDDKEGDKEEVEMTWSGVIGVSSDEMPWVGRGSGHDAAMLHPRPTILMIDDPRIANLITCRLPDEIGGKESGEVGMVWIAAGYSGGGMVHAWLSGKALAEMVGGDLANGLSSPFRIVEERWKRTGIKDLIVRLLSD
ncbi:hypothetical protein M378DRAFT_193437 [Amanita muscaria Koide BX008]|uniref:FAD dependent oxidoreductase domain-containing protein n=1 Tax=Amanita muscaria (strain Koide BX008) TaxID=946122 RepID=A0A0C2WXA6_AMAMK|nr:hypothetical protein M378DRAFT_193437 [Amanita muscaria Koide BX008]